MICARGSQASGRAQAVQQGNAALILRRLFGLAATMLAALSTAQAEVQQIGTPATQGDTDFARYASRDVSDPWLEALLRRTWLDIWIEMLRDEIFVDTTDHMASEPAVAPSSLTLSGPDSGGSPPSKNSPGVADCQIASGGGAECEITAALLATGWTDPNAASAAASGQSPFVWPATFGEWPAFASGSSFSDSPYDSMTRAFADATPFGWCCSPNGRSQGTFGDAAQPVTVGGSSSPIGGQFGGQPGVSSGDPPSIPEPSIPAMLLIGLCSLALVTKIGTFRRSAG